MKNKKKWDYTPVLMRYYYILDSLQVLDDRLRQEFSKPRIFSKNPVSVNDLIESSRVLGEARDDFWGRFKREHPKAKGSLTANHNGVFESYQPPIS
jgi:hypothetical protein